MSDKGKPFIRKTPEEIRSGEKLIKKIYDKNNREHITKMAKLHRGASRLSKYRNGFKARTYYYIKRMSIGEIPRQSDFLGADAMTIRQHFEKLFKEGMCWQNFGIWQVDHKIPLCSGKSEEEILRLCHYSNLQPLWAVDNMKKGKKIINEYKFI